MPRDATRIRLVIFDWAGTAVDHGSRGPLIPFVRVFAERGVEVTPEEARGPMGLSKRDHLRALLRLPAVARRWREQQGGDATEDDVDELYRRFMPLQLEVIDEFAGVVPGLLDCVGVLRGRGLAVGATTGYFREAAERVYRRAAAQGFRPDHCVCAEEVSAGRPAPWMIFRIMEAAGIYPPARVAKVGDTVPDVEEGLNAGAWSIGVTESSSEVGCSLSEWQMLDEDARREKRSQARSRLLAAGAHHVIDSLAELPELLRILEGR